MKQLHTLTREQRIEALRKELARLRTEHRRTRGFRRGIIADEIAIGMVNFKTTAVRVIPAYGKGVGDSVSFGGLLGYAPIMDINNYSPSKFIHRGGRIPAPIQSLKN